MYIRFCNIFPSGGRVTTALFYGQLYETLSLIPTSFPVFRFFSTPHRSFLFVFLAPRRFRYFYGLFFHLERRVDVVTYLNNTFSAPAAKLIATALPSDPVHRVKRGQKPKVKHRSFRSLYTPDLWIRLRICICSWWWKLHMWLASANIIIVLAVSAKDEIHLIIGIFYYKNISYYSLRVVSTCVGEFAFCRYQIILKIFNPVLILRRYL